MKKLLTLFTILAIAVTMSCERLPEKKAAPPTKGDLQTIKISDLKGIPLEYGTLVAITTRGTDTGKVELWFEDVNVGFFRGAEIADPDGLQEGTGKFMRHVKLRPESKVDARALMKLIETAYTDMKGRLKAK